MKADKATDTTDIKTHQTLILRYLEHLKMSDLWVFYINRGNNLATVLISANVHMFACQTTLFVCKNTTIYWIHNKMYAF